MKPRLKDLLAQAAREEDRPIDLVPFAGQPLWEVMREVERRAALAKLTGTRARALLRPFFPALGAHLGKGKAAHVFALGADRVVKLTVDPTDAAGMRLAQRIRTRPSALPKVWSVRTLPGSGIPLFAIEVERLQTSGRWKRSVLGDLQALANEMVVRHRVPEGIEGVLEPIASALRALEFEGHLTLDVHEKNVMVRPSTGELVLADLGYATIRGPLQVRGSVNRSSEITAWHGTQQERPFTRFEPEKGRSFGGPFNNMGSWFTSTREAALLYAPRVDGREGRLYEVRLRLQNPWVLPHRDGEAFDVIANYIGHAAGRHGLTRRDIVHLTASDIRAFRERLGPHRDGIQIEDFEEVPGYPRSTVYVVFDPANIRIVRSEPVPPLR